MGTQNKYARYPLPPATVPARPYPILWDARRKTLAVDCRESRELFGKVGGANLVHALDSLRPAAATNYRALRLYRAALHEAVVSRHWTVEWSALTNTHTIR